MKKTPIFLTLFLATSFVAQAHPGFGRTGGFPQGFQHPLTGLDHLLAMIAVGLWAAQTGGRALWAIPATFVGTMALGGLLAMTGISVPFVEPGIATSVLLLGLLIAFAVRLPVIASAPLVALFALFHGHAHGTEVPETASGIMFSVGFVLATALLHCIGIGAGMLMGRDRTSAMVRTAGAAIAVAGVVLLAA